MGKDLGEMVEHALNVVTIATSVAAGTFGQGGTLGEHSTDAWGARESAQREDRDEAVKDSAKYDN